MKMIKWTIDNFEKGFGSILLAVMVTLIFVQVFSRFVFNHSIPWSEELSRFIFLVLVYFTMSFAAKEGQHIRVDDHIKKLPKSIKNALLIFSDIIWIVFNIVVIIDGFKLVEKMNQYPLYSAVLGWNLKYLFLFIPICFIFTTIRIVQSRYQQIVHLRQ
jgi:C4-dicarboxylate transporter DctQ subunit